MRLAVLACLIGLQLTAAAQQKWNLRSIIDHAMYNNLNVRITDLQSKNAELNYKQSRLSQYPNANFSASSSLNSGSNQDPTSFSRITESYLSAGLQLQTSADIFNFYSKRNTIAANGWEVQAARANTDKVKNDIALSAANAYLQILLALEQKKIAEVQLKQSQDQLIIVRKQVRAGALPELNASQLEAQVAMDSSNVIAAAGNISQNVLNLKALMNIDANSFFEIETPPVDQIPVEAIADLQPETVYQLALANQPLQRYNELKLKAAEKNKEAARGAMYPTLGAFGSLGSGYNNKNKKITGYTISGTQRIGTVNVSGTNYDVVAPDGSFNYENISFPKQLSDNFRQSIGLSLSVPIFNGGSLKTNYERSKVSIRSWELQKEADNQKLKQDIYAAYNAAIVALEKYNAARKAVETNEKAYGFAQKRFNVGMLGTFELLTQQNNLLRSKLEYALNRYDYVFKMKVLEFYKGQGLKL
ncbi:MAG: TolC family protein [Ferruginibacter sp.]